MTDMEDPMADLSWWDRLVIGAHVWWWGKRHKYCTACDVIHHPRDPAHRACHCGISQPNTWSPEAREAFTTIIDAAKRHHAKGPK